MNVDRVMSSLASSGVLGGLAGGALSGALVGSKKARMTAGTLLKVGGVAALGGLAWRAYQGYQNGQGATAAAPEGTPQTGREAVWSGLKEQQFRVEAPGPDKHSPALLLIKAMIAAACADGHLDQLERQRIMACVSDAALAPDERALVVDALQSPPSLGELTEQVDTPELAAEVYMASLVSVDSRRVEAELYLDALAYRLGLPEQLVAEMHKEVVTEDRAVA